MAENDYQIELERRLTRLETNMESLQEVPAQLAALTLKFSKYEGKWGGVIMIGTAVWALIVTFKDNFLEMFK